MRARKFYMSLASFTAHTITVIPFQSAEIFISELKQHRKKCTVSLLPFKPMQNLNWIALLMLQWKHLKNLNHRGVIN